MAERIGMEAVLDDKNFQAGMSRYLKGINQMVDRTDRGSKSVSSFGTAFASGIGAAIGTATINALEAAGRAIMGLGKEALDAVGSFEMMGLSFQTLVARDIARGKIVEQTSQQIRTLSEEERAEIDKLRTAIQEETLDRETLAARINEQKEKIRQMTEVWTDEGLNVQTARARLAEMEFEYEKSAQKISEMTSEMNKLAAVEGEVVTITEEVRTGQMSLSEAMDQASPKAQELLKWTQQLAIQSPFDQEGVALAFRTVLAYGFATSATRDLAGGTEGVIQAQKEGIITAERITQAMIDYVAGTGQSVQVMDRVGLALGQIRARGKLAGQEVRQLTEAGIAVDEILAEAFGKSVTEIVKLRESGLMPADDAIKAIVETLERDFGGAAARTTGTISGLLNSLGDIKKIALREFFTNTFKAVQPYVAEFVDAVALDPEKTFAPLRMVGELLGSVVGRALERILSLVSAFRAGGFGGILESLGLSGEASTLIANLTQSLSSLASVIMGVLKTALDWLIQNALPIMGQAISFINAHWEEFKGALIGVGIVLASASVLGAIIQITTALGLLLSPVGLLIGAAALLGAAWAGNWLGIRDILTQFWESTGRPILTQLMEWLQVNLPIAIQATVDFWENRLQPALIAVGSWIRDNLIPTLGDIAIWLGTNVPIAVQAVSDFFSNVLIPTLTTVYEWLAATLPVAIQILTDFFSNVLIPVISGVADWLGTNLPIAIQIVSDFFSNVLIPIVTTVIEWLGTNLPIAIQTVSDFFNNILLPVVGMVGEWLGTNVPLAIQTLTDFFNNRLLPAVTAVTSFMGETLIPFLSAVGEVISAVVVLALEALVGLLQNVVIPALGGLVLIIGENVLPVLSDIGSFINDVVGPALAWLGDTLLPDVSGGFGGISEKIQQATQWLLDLAETIRGIELPQWLKPGSPTPFEIGLVGIASALSTVVSAALQAFAAQTLAIFTQVRILVQSIDFTLNKIAMETLPTLSLQSVQTATTMLLQFQSTIPILTEVLNILREMTASLLASQQAAIAASQAITEGFQEGTDKIKDDLIPALESLIDWLDKVTQAAEDAAEATNSVGGSSPSPPAAGPGAQFGANFVVPPGFPNDTFPLRVSSRERVIVIPPGGGGTTAGASIQIGPVYIENDMDMATFETRLRRIMERA